MALAITAVGNADPNAPGVNLSVSGLLSVAGGATFTITRNQPFTDEVRNADTLALSIDTFAITDYEARWIYNQQYTVHVFNAAGAEIATATATDFQLLKKNFSISYPYNYFMLRDVFNPSNNSHPVWTTDFQPYSFDGRSTESVVIGRRNPVIQLEKVGGRKGSFTIVGDTGTEDSLTGGSVYLFQSMTQPDVIVDLYFVITSIKMEFDGHPSCPYGTTGTPTNNLGNMVPLYTVAFTEIDRPQTTGGSTFGFASWQRVASRYPTWQDVLNANPDWNSVITSNIT